MSQEKIYVRNMVCPRCILAVEGLLRELGIEPVLVMLGEVTLREPLSDLQQNELKSRLTALGFEWIDDKRVRLIEQVKKALIELVHRENSTLKTNLSDYIAGRTHHDYNYVSHLFSEVENTTIEKYFIAQKIERVKELLVYDELSLSEIADLLNYSSAAHLSAQFKKVTGLTPSHFKQVKENKRKPLDQV